MTKLRMLLGSVLFACLAGFAFVFWVAVVLAELWLDRLTFNSPFNLCLWLLMLAFACYDLDKGVVLKENLKGRNDLQPRTN